MKLLCLLGLHRFKKYLTPPNQNHRVYPYRRCERCLKFKELKDKLVATMYAPYKTIHHGDTEEIKQLSPLEGPFMEYPNKK